MDKTNNKIKNALIKTIQPKKKIQKNIKLLSLRDIYKTDFPPIKFMVKDLLPEGLTILGGKPKIGKSFFALQLAIAVAKGLNFLKVLPCEKNSVLFLPYEDTLSRIKDRIKQKKEAFIPKNLFIPEFIQQFPTEKENGILEIKRIIKEKNVNLIIIDTMSRFFANSSYGKLNYNDDYNTIAKLQKIAVNGVAIIIIHHTIKTNSDYPFDMLQGSVGVTASPDTLMVLQEYNTNFILHVKGRDIAHKKLSLTFSNKLMKWQLVNNLFESKLSAESKKVLLIFKKNPKTSFSLTDIHKQVNDKSPQNTDGKLKLLLNKGLIKKIARGVYEYNSEFYSEHISK